MAMLIAPPKRTALNGGGADYGKNKLCGARGVKSFVGKIAVIKSGDGEHAHEIQKNCRTERKPTPTYKKYSEAAEMQKNKRQDADEFHFVRPGADGGEVAVAVVGIKPLGQ